MNENTTRDTWLWERVNAALDRREDPFEDWELAQGLASAPELAAQFVQLLGNLEQLSPAEPLSTTAIPRTSAQHWELSIAGAAAVLIAAFVVWRKLPTTAFRTSAPRAQSVALAFRRGEPTIVYTTERTDPSGTTRRELTNGRETHAFEPRARQTWIPLPGATALQPSPGDTLTYTRSTTLSANR